MSDIAQLAAQCAAQAEEIRLLKTYLRHHYEDDVAAFDLSFTDSEPARQILADEAAAREAARRAKFGPAEAVTQAPKSRRRKKATRP